MKSKTFNTIELFGLIFLEFFSFNLVQISIIDDILVNNRLQYLLLD